MSFINSNEEIIYNIFQFYIVNVDSLGNCMLILTTYLLLKSVILLFTS